MDNIFVLQDADGYLCDYQIAHDARTCNLAHAKQYTCKMAAETVAKIKCLTVMQLYAFVPNAA